MVYAATRELSWDTKMRSKNSSVHRIGENMKHAATCLLFILVIFGVSVLAQDAKPARSGLPAGISEWVGDDSDKILKNKIIGARLKKLLGERDHRAFLEYFETSKPIEKSGGILFTSGCMIRSCNHLESAIAIDLENNTIHAAIFDQIEDTKYFNEGGAETPASIINWAKRLESLKGTEEQTKAVLIDEFRFANSEDLMARFDNFTVQLQNQPNSTGRIDIIGNKNSRTNAEREIKQYIKRRNLDVKKFVFLKSEGDRSALIKLWLVPEGTKPPEAVS